MKLIIIYGDIFNFTNVVKDRRRLFKNGDVYDGFALSCSLKEEELTDSGKVTIESIDEVLPYVSTRVSHNIEYKKHIGGGILSGLYYGIVGKHKPSSSISHKAILICRKDSNTINKLKNKEWSFFIKDGESRRLETDFKSQIYNEKIAYAINFHRGPLLSNKTEKLSDGWNGSWGCITGSKNEFDQFIDKLAYNEKIYILLIREQKGSSFDRTLLDNFVNLEKNVVETLTKIISEVGNGS